MQITIGPQKILLKNVIRLLFSQSTEQTLKFSIKDFFSKCNQIHSFQRIWSYLVKKSLMENFIFCAVVGLFLKIFLKLHEKCPNTEFFWSVFSRIWTEYGHLLCKSLYSPYMRENTDQKILNYKALTSNINL